MKVTVEKPKIITLLYTFGIGSYFNSILRFKLNSFDTHKQPVTRGKFVTSIAKPVPTEIAIKYITFKTESLNVYTFFMNT